MSSGLPAMPPEASSAQGISLPENELRKGRNLLLPKRILLFLPSPHYSNAATSSFCTSALKKKVRRSSMSLLWGNRQPGCALGQKVMPGCPLTPSPALLKGTHPV